MLLPMWLAINGWTNITQLETLDIEAAPAMFRLVTTATVLERPIYVHKLGTHPTLYWLEQLQQDNAKTDDIMKGLKKHNLQRLAIPILKKQVADINHPAFSKAKDWIQKLEN